MTASTKEPSLFPQTCNNHDTDVIECLINLPSNPLTIINIQNHELNDLWLLDTQQCNPLRYSIKTMNNNNIIYFRKITNQLDQHWKVYIPPALIQPAIRWYRLVLGHPGAQVFTAQCTWDSTILAYLYYATSTTIDALPTAACTRTMKDHTVT